MAQLVGPPIDQTEVGRALGRIGIPNRDPFRWEALNWFVVFAQRDLTSATEGDWLLLNEEIQALLHLITQQQLAVPFTRDELQALQKKGLGWLTLLVDEGSTLMGTFQVHVYVRRGKPFTGTPRIRRWGGLMMLPSHNFAGHIPPGGLLGLEYHFACLLERWPETVQRCPKCHRLFARFRRHAEFCSRKCQSQVAASEYRGKQAENKKERLKKKAEATKKKLTKKKGASR